jgi:hypothetical protein
MKRTLILGSMTAFLLAACGGDRAGGDAGTTGTADTAPAGGAMDTAMTGGAMDTAMTDTTGTSSSTDTTAR